MTTINHSDEDVGAVAAALADACHAGGLADAYYRSADKALGRVARELVSLRKLAKQFDVWCEQEGATEAESDALDEMLAVRAELRGE